jgi:hypothetical protein
VARATAVVCIVSGGDVVPSVVPTLAPSTTGGAILAESAHAGGLAESWAAPEALCAPIQGRK